MPFDLQPEPEYEISIVKTFRIRPSDWDEVVRVAAIYRMEPSKFARRLILMGLDEAKKARSLR